MKKLFLFLFIIVIISCNKKENTLEKEKIIENIFNTNNINGTFVFYDLNKNKYTIYNKERAEKRYYPASTFKIFNSLIALDSKVVNDVDEIFYTYNGEKVFLESWATNSNLRYAIKVSQVPAYKYIAKKVGLENMKKYIEKLEFGNKNIGEKIDTFWLEGPLEISSIEQVELLTKLVKKELPFSNDIQESVIDIIKLEDTDKYTLYGKTGLTDYDNESIGWFIGFASTKNNKYIFALNIDNINSSYLEKRINISKLCLDALINN